MSKLRVQSRANQLSNYESASVGNDGAPRVYANSNPSAKWLFSTLLTQYRSQAPNVPSPKVPSPKEGFLSTACRQFSSSTSSKKSQVRLSTGINNSRKNVNKKPGQQNSRFSCRAFCQTKVRCMPNLLNLSSKNRTGFGVKSKMAKFSGFPRD